MWGRKKGLKMKSKDQKKSKVRKKTSKGLYLTSHLICLVIFLKKMFPWGTTAFLLSKTIYFIQIPPIVQKLWPPNKGDKTHQI